MNLFWIGFYEDCTVPTHRIVYQKLSYYLITVLLPRGCFCRWCRVNVIAKPSRFARGFG
jgi:hypothetical protein